MAIRTIDIWMNDKIRYQTLSNRERALSEQSDYIKFMHFDNFEQLFKYHVSRIDIWVNGRKTFVDEILQILTFRTYREFGHRMRIAEFILFCADWESGGEKLTGNGFMRKLSSFYFDIQNAREKARKEKEKSETHEKTYSPVEYYELLISQGKEETAEDFRIRFLPFYNSLKIIKLNN